MKKLILFLFSFILTSSCVRKGVDMKYKVGEKVCFHNGTPATIINVQKGYQNYYVSYFNDHGERIVDYYVSESELELCE